jgi:hypothetical protein
MDPVGINKIRNPRRTSDSGNTNDFFMGNAKFLHNIEKRSKHSKITAPRTPRWVIGSELFFSKRLGG